MEPVLRRLTPDDAAEVAALIRHAFARMTADIDPPPSAVRETAESVATALTVDGGAGVEAGGRLVAAVLWREQDQGLYINRLSVRENWRGLGLARTLMAEAEREARGRGLLRLHLSTRLALEGNRRLFATCGLRETALHAHAGYAVPTYVEMEKHLSP